MAEILVTLSEDDVRQACEYWATHRILNVGKAVSSDLTVMADNTKPPATLNSVKVWVETDQMKSED